MKRSFVAALGTLLSISAACGGGNSTTSPSPTYNDISGGYSGALAGTSQGVLLTGTFSLTITQASATTGGSYAIVGVLNNGISSQNIQGTGTISGTVAAGNNPSVNMALAISGCPNQQSNFSGAYDTTNRKLTMSGNIYIVNPNCTVALTYPSTIILSR